jgi:hypothetical protein
MQNLDHNIGFREKRHFFAENWRKSQKIVIITSTPGVEDSSNPDKALGSRKVVAMLLKQNATSVRLVVPIMGQLIRNRLAAKTSSVP